MNRSIEWFAKNPVAANLTMVLLVVGGLFTLSHVKYEVFPEFSLDRVTVSVEYLGAAPEEVEEAVCIRIEEAVDGVEDIKRVTSTAAEGRCNVALELELGADSGRVLDDVKARVDAIDTFPAETEKPVISELTNRRQVIDISVWGDADERTLKVVAENVRDELAQLDGITLVELANARPYEISIEISELALRRHGLTFADVATAIRRSSIDLPGGQVRTSSGDILLRARGQAEIGEEFEDIAILVNPDGTRVTLADVATVIDGFAETDQATRFNGKRAVLLEVFRTSDESPIEIVEIVRDYVDAAQPRMPHGVFLTPWQDSAKILKDRISVLTRNGLSGAFLVFVTLALFLRFRLAFWVSIGIPVSFFGATALMPYLDVSINLISLFAFILVLGIVVDDAIVAGENIYTHQQRHRKGLEGSIEGAKEIAVPVVFAVLTTIAAFSPLVMVDGTIGKVMRVIPLIVIPCLAFSLVESLWILPAHLRHVKPTPKETAWRRFQSRFANGLEWFAERVYLPSLDVALKFRYATIAVGIALLAIIGGLTRHGFIGFQFFPPVESEYVAVALTMPQGTPAKTTAAILASLEAEAETVKRQLEEQGHDDVVRHVITSIGAQPYRAVQGQNAGRLTAVETASHLGEVILELAPAEDRTISSTEIADRWRERNPVIPDAVEVAYDASLFTAGEDVNVRFTGPDLASIRSASEELKAGLAEYTNVHEITDSFREGKRQIEFAILPSGELLGLTLSDVARQVRAAFYGEEAQRVVRGREDLRVMVRYPEAERGTLASLDEFRIRTPDGRQVPFHEVATATHGRGYSTITRVDRRRSVDVTAEVDEKAGRPAGAILADLEARVLPWILERHPGVLYSFEGQNKEQRDTLGGLTRGLFLAMIVIYVLLAIPLKSYVQPLIIMAAIPFGLVGAALGHVLLGLDLTILSMFGIVALAGVVVNDSLVMVDFINRNRRETGDLNEAIRLAGARRFRPILLTSLTTFAGLTPLMLEKSLQAQFLIPMAVSLAFGVMFATSITLILLPASYRVLGDVLDLGGRYWRWQLGRSGGGDGDAGDADARGTGVAGATG